MRNDALAQWLIDRYQRDMPLEPRPFAAMGAALGQDEQAVLDTLAALAADGTLSRVGAVIPPGVLGASTLAAMEVPPDRLDVVADHVSRYPEVNHNYEREHRLNLWFVVAADDRDRVAAVLASIERHTGLAVIDLPLEQAYHIDLGFDVSWR